MNERLTAFTRFVCIIGAIGLFASIFTPLWKIELSAPQYPEGLVMKIYPNKLGGDVEVINGLNHYIGMRTLHESDFVEFTILPYLIGVIALFGLLSFFVNRKWFFLVWAVIFIAFGIIAMLDFYRWEYNYGHNLDPAAPIKVPGMSYQPPMLGYKQLLNFGAYSIPDIGGWIFIGVGVIVLAALVMEIRKTVTITRKLEIKAASTGAVMMLMMMSCSSGPEPIRIGTDACDFCRMSFSDARFASEIETLKGKIYKFDDMHCLKAYLDSQKKDQKNIKEIWFTDFNAGEKFIASGNAVFVKSETLKSPMGGKTAAFADKAAAENFLKDHPGEQHTWAEIKP